MGNSKYPNKLKKMDQIRGEIIDMTINLELILMRIIALTENSTLINSTLQKKISFMIHFLKFAQKESVIH